MIRLYFPTKMVAYHLVRNVNIYHKCCGCFLKWEGNQKKNGRKHFFGFREKEGEEHNNIAQYM